MTVRTKNRIIILAVALLGIVFLIILFSAKSNIDEDYQNYTYDPNYINQLDSIIVLEQDKSYSCNITAMAIIKTYLGIETSEAEIRSELGIENRKKGMLPNEYLRYANKTLEPLSYSVSLLNPKSDETILKIIVASLTDNLPVVILYSTENSWNKPNYDTHYAVIYGIDIKNEIVMISNPYGYLEELTFSELYEGLNFKSYKSEPIYHRLGRMIGMPKENNLFILKKIEE